MYMFINGVNSSTIPQCQLIDIDEVKGATPRRSSTTIHGLNGRFDLLDGAYDGYERTLTFLVKEHSNIQRLIDLFQEKKNIIEFWYQLESQFYCDYIESSYKPYGLHYWSVEITVYMYPFRYQKNPADVILTSRGTIINPGNIYSEPVIILEGNGEVSLTIGNQTMVIDVQERVTIDCRQQEQKILDKNGAVKNTLRKRGPFFELVPGRSGVVYSGNLSKITIKGNWRYKI